VTCNPLSTPWSSKYREFRAIGKMQRSCAGSLPQPFTEKSEVRGVNPVLVRKKAKACGSVLYGIALGLVLALPGCNTACSAAEVRNGCWPAIGSKAEQEALCSLPGHCAHSTPTGGGIGP
jgi:hypothetical protein